MEHKYAIELLTKQIKTHLSNADYYTKRAKKLNNFPGLQPREEGAAIENKKQAEELKLAIEKLKQ